MRLRPPLGDFGALFSEGVESDEEFHVRVKHRQRRSAAFHETPLLRVKRTFKAAVRLLQPWRLSHLPSTLDLFIREKLVRPSQLPDPRAGLTYAEGLAGLAPDLTPETMLQAYSMGLSPSACLGPVAWHSREKRWVALPTDVARHMRAHARPGEPEWDVAFDRDADTVVAASGRADSGGSAMPERLLEAFAGLFDAGFAHTFEVRDNFGRIVGGQDARQSKVAEWAPDGQAVRAHCCELCATRDDCDFRASGREAEAKPYFDAAIQLVSQGHTK